MATPTGDKQFMQFNTQISWLINLVKKIYPSNDTIDRAASRISLAKQADPTILIKIVGPYLLSYRQNIIDYDDEFVLNMDISEKTDDEFIQTIFHMITQAYKNFKPKERNTIKDKINDMLNTYMEYLIEIG
jgi:hypothetical protein